MLNMSANRYMQALYQSSAPPEHVILPVQSQELITQDTSPERELIIVESQNRYETVYGDKTTTESTYKVVQKFPLKDKESALQEVNQDDDDHMNTEWADFTHSTYTLYSVPKDQYKTGDVLESLPPNSELVYP